MPSKMEHKQKLRMKCDECGFTVRRYWPIEKNCEHCGGMFALAPRETKLTPRDRLHIALLGYMVDSGMVRGHWTYTAVGEAFGVDRKTVVKCMAAHPHAAR